MRFVSERQRKAIFAKLRENVLSGDGNVFARTVVIPEGAPYPYSADQVRKRREREQVYQVGDGFGENVVEAGLGAGLGALGGMMLKGPESGFVRNVGIPTATMSLFNPLAGVATGVGSTLYNYPYALPGAVIGGIATPILFAHNPEHDELDDAYEDDPYDSEIDTLVKETFPNTRRDADNFFQRKETVQLNLDGERMNEYALYGGRTVEELQDEQMDTETEYASPDVIYVQTVPQVREPERRGGLWSGLTGAVKGGLAAGAVGQVGPQALVGEEIFTVPAGIGWGFMRGYQGESLVPYDIVPEVVAGRLMP